MDFYYCTNCGREVETFGPYDGCPYCGDDEAELLPVSLPEDGE